MDGWLGGWVAGWLGGWVVGWLAVGLGLGGVWGQTHKILGCFKTHKKPEHKQLQTHKKHKIHEKGKCTHATVQSFLTRDPSTECASCEPTISHPREPTYTKASVVSLHNSRLGSPKTYSRNVHGGAQNLSVATQINPSSTSQRD